MLSQQKYRVRGNSSPAYEEDKQFTEDACYKIIIPKETINFLVPVRGLNIL